MIEKSPQNNIENEKDRVKREKIALAKELFESGEIFPFPGLKPGKYEEIKAGEEEFPGFHAPIDELLERFKNEGVKVVLGKFPESGNVFVLPGGSDDIVNDSLFPRHLATDGSIDDRLLSLILMG